MLFIALACLTIVKASSINSKLNLEEGSGPQDTNGLQDTSKFEEDGDGPSTSLLNLESPALSIWQTNVMAAMSNFIAALFAIDSGPGSQMVLGLPNFFVIILIFIASLGGERARESLLGAQSGLLIAALVINVMRGFSEPGLIIAQTLAFLSSLVAHSKALDKEMVTLEDRSEK